MPTYVELRMLTPRLWRRLKRSHSYITPSGSTHFLSRDLTTCFHVHHEQLRCCTEGTMYNCPYTFGGRSHNGHRRLATRFLIDQELNIAFRHIVSSPPPSVVTSNDVLACFLQYGAILVRSVVPVTHNIHPLWPSRPGTPIFREFKLKMSRNIIQLRESQPLRVSKAFLPVPAWTEENTEELAEMLEVPHRICSSTYMAQCSSGLHTAGAAAGFVGYGFPHYSGSVNRPVGVEVAERECLLLEPSEDGEMQDDGEVPTGYKFIFPLFGERIDADGDESHHADDSEADEESEETDREAEDTPDEPVLLPGVSDGDDDEFEMGVEDVAVDGADVMDNNVGIQQDVLTPAEANRNQPIVSEDESEVEEVPVRTDSFNTPSRPRREAAHSSREKTARLFSGGGKRRLGPSGTRHEGVSVWTTVLAEILCVRRHPLKLLGRPERSSCSEMPDTRWTKASSLTPSIWPLPMFAAE